MRWNIKRPYDIWRESRIYNLLFGIKRYLIGKMIGILFEFRRWLPPIRDYALLNGKKTAVVHMEYKKLRPFDRLLRDYAPSINPDEKNANIDVIKKHVQEKDSVVVIGGGYGLSATFAAEEVGPKGKVTIYEGDSNSIESVKKTLEMNNVTERCEVIHAIVADEYRLIGEGEGGHAVPPSEIKECDVLEMDCEGAEINIIKELKIRPRVLIIEQHHHKDYAPYSSPDIIPNILDDYGYNVKVKNARAADQIIVATQK